MKKWSNSDNKSFYDNVPLDILREWGDTSGLNSYCDVGLLNEYIDEATSILDVGAGYGRIFAYILNRNYAGKLYGIERSEKMCAFLKDNFSKNVEVFNNDILAFKTPLKFDLVLWLWATISDFTPKEQQDIFNLVSGILKKNKYFVVDVIPPDRKPRNATESHDRECFFETAYGTNHGYFPLPEEVFLYAQNAGLSSKEVIDYETPTGRNRRLYVFTKSNTSA